MNFLAHLYLSGADHQLMIGNFIADMVRGKEVEEYDEKIINGIHLHRAIDHYTDAHPVVKESVTLLKPSQGRYATVIVDIAFDHFLAANWRNYHDVDLLPFTNYVYKVMQSNNAILPDKFQAMLPKMIEENWLYQYQYLDGIQKAFEGMARRASFDSNMAFAVEDLKSNYDELSANFETFFEDIVAFVKAKGVSLSE